MPFNCNNILIKSTEIEKKKVHIMETKSKKEWGGKKLKTNDTAIDTVTRMLLPYYTLY